MDRIDREIRALGNTTLRHQMPRDFWQNFGQSLQTIYGDERSNQLVVRVLDAQGGALYSSSQCPREMAEMSLPVLEFDESSLPVSAGHNEPEMPATPPPRPSARAEPRMPPPPPLARMKIPVFQTMKTSDDEWRVGILGNDTVTMVIGVSLAAYHRDFDRVRNAFLIAVPLGLLVLAAGGWLLATRALRPVALITRTAEGITARGLDKRIPTTAADADLARLVEVINGVTQTWDSASGTLQITIPSGGSGSGGSTNIWLFPSSAALTNNRLEFVPAGGLTGALSNYADRAQLTLTAPSTVANANTATNALNLAGVSAANFTTNGGTYPGMTVGTASYVVSLTNALINAIATNKVNNAVTSDYVVNLTNALVNAIATNKVASATAADTATFATTAGIATNIIAPTLFAGNVGTVTVDLGSRMSYCGTNNLSVPLTLVVTGMVAGGYADVSLLGNSAQTITLSTGTASTNVMAGSLPFVPTNNADILINCIQTTPTTNLGVRVRQN